MKTKIVSPTLVHFIYMNGSSGCIPDSCSAYDSRESCVENFEAIFDDSTEEQSKDLLDTGYVNGLNGADYASIEECSCSAPWEHTEDDSADNWPDYVKSAALEFLATLETHEYQDQVIEHNEHCRCTADRPDTYYCRAWTTRIFYMLPYASFGEYDNSTALERSNARQFKEEFSFVSSHAVGYGEYTGIDETDIEFIKFEDIERLKELCDSLEDYPCINDEDVSFVEMELQNEAWSSWACSDFRRELKAYVGADQDEKLEEQIDELDEDTLREMMETAAQDANEYWVIESGGNAHIDFDRLLKFVELPETDEELADRKAAENQMLIVPDTRHCRKCGNEFSTNRETWECSNCI